MSPTARKPAISNAAGTVGERVRDARRHLGLSQEALAEGSELHWSYIGQVERGQKNMTLHNLLRIASALDVDPAELVRGLKPPTN
jgi:transcriptional regulator with XRE-family HTH domain